jgi:beta-lactamase regulating signal transducer with metallopeptidase domain
VIDHLWQSTLLVGVIALVMPLFRRQRACLRFWLWFAASVKFLFPFSVLVWLGGFLPALPEPAPLLAARSLVVTPVLIAPAHLMPAAHWLWLAWAAGALFLGLRWLARLWSLHAALKDAPRLAVESPVPVKLVASFLEPGLVGILRPVIVMPRGVAQALSAGEMRAVLAHELAHLSRRDNLWASIQMLVEMLFWFHPLVWWVGARLVAERERACDQAVLETGNAPRIYAEGILKICRFHLEPSPACAVGVSGGNLKARMAGIMRNGGSDDADGARILLLTGLGMTALLLPLMAGAPGSAPMNRLARQVATSVLQAPQLPALPQIAAPAPPPAVRHHRKRMAAMAVQPAPAVTAAEPVAPEPVAAPAPQSQGSVIYSTVSAALPALPSAETAPQAAGDSLVCRKPQRLIGSRLLGPSVCLKASEWAALHAEGRTMSPDGRMTVALSNYEQTRSIHPPSDCARFTVGASTGFQVLPQTVCF